MNSSNRGSMWSLNDFIREYNAEDFRVDSFFLKQVFWDQSTMNHKIIVAESSIIDKYKTELDENKTAIELSTQEYFKYRYNPKLLSYDIYGTTELWFLILMANEMYSVTEFDLHKIVLYNAEIINKVNHMLNMDSDFLEINSMEIKAETDSGIN